VNYVLELVHARWSQCHNEVNTAVHYCAVPVYCHAFSATALDGDVQLASLSDGLSPQKGPQLRTEMEAWNDKQKGLIGKE